MERTTIGGTMESINIEDDRITLVLKGNYSELLQGGESGAKRFDTLRGFEGEPVSVRIDCYPSLDKKTEEAKRAAATGR